MSIPVLSSQIVADTFLTPMRKSAYADYELGGVAVRDTTQGLMVKLWESSYDGFNIVLKNDVSEFNLVAGSGVDYVSFAFDQNMNPCVVYNIGDVTYLNWYDPTQSKQVTTQYPLYTTPQLSLDDHRQQFSGNSDIIFSYILDGNLCTRVQRERYREVRILKSIPNYVLTQTGMGHNMRFRWRYIYKHSGG